MIQTLSKLLLLYLAFFSFLSPALSLYEGSESFTDYNPIPELYVDVPPDYMKYVISNLTSLLNNYVFTDILQKPIEPYTDIKVDMSKIFDNIDTSKERPFYEFYRDLKIALSASHDANLDITGGLAHLGDEILRFREYKQCLPFKFYVDYKDTKEAKLFIKEYETCSQYYDENTRKSIKDHENKHLTAINGTDPFDYLQNFGTEFYKFKNPETQFSIIIDSIHDNFLGFTPLSLDNLKPFNLTFVDGTSLETKFNIYTKEFQEKKEQANGNVTWNYTSKGGEIKCKVDSTNKLNVLFIKNFLTEGNSLQYCVELFQKFNYKLVIITSQLWEEENENSFGYLQLFFPKISSRYNMAMKPTNYNKLLFEENEEKFLNTETCEPFKTWEEFVETNPDDYGDGIKHYRTKPFYPFSKSDLIDINDFRKKLITKGNLKKSTEVLIFTDYVNFGAAGTFIKTIQNNGAAIIASYAGNPYSNKTSFKTLDVGIDPALNTNYKYISKEYEELHDLGIEVYIPFAEAFESSNITGEYKYPMAFKVNKPDEITDIYHFFDDIYYDEFINKAKEIFEKYNEKQECNKDNKNLVYEMNTCSFKDDSNAHGGFSCGDDGKWAKTCKKSYCNYGYFYDKTNDKCQIDTCIADEIIEINEETEKTITIDPNKKYIIDLNTNLYTYFIKSPVDNIVIYSDLVDICPRFCVIKGKEDYIYINYERNLKEPVVVTIISKKLDMNVESYLLKSPNYADIRPVPRSAYIFQFIEDNYMFIDSYDKSAKFYYAEYDENMTPDDIINVNKKYFKDGLGQLMFLPKDRVYIGIFTQELGFAKMYFQNALPPTINLKNGDKTILFLNTSTSSYKLNFTGNTLPFMIRLNEKTNGSCLIDDDDKETDPKNLTLTDKYFTPSKQPYTGIIEINEIKATEGQGILIEILYQLPQEQTEVITGEKINYDITKNVTLVQFNPSDKDKKIMKIMIESKGVYSFGVYGGPSKDNFFYYSQNNIPKNTFTTSKIYYITLDDPLKDIQKEEKEVYYISLMFSKKDPSTTLKITVQYESNLLEELYEPIDETYAKNIISNLTSIIEKYYIFDDISKNPPQIEGLPNYTHPRVNLTQRLNAIQAKDRKFYDFYREIREILGTPRDLHFNIYALNTPSGFKFSQMTACLPFSFYVDKVENETEPKVYIKYYSNCAPYFSEKIRKRVQEKEKKKIALEKINDKDPFDFIQECGEKYERTKSPHGQFSLVKTLIHDFPLYLNPLNQSELSMEFKFENDNETLNLDYYIYMPNFRTMNNLLGSNQLSQEEFDKFYENEMLKDEDNVIRPNIFEVERRYKKYKGLLLEAENESPIKWDYEISSSSGFLKCRVDEKNQLNVILQTTFSLDIQSAINIIDKCVDLFHSNKYQVVVIENANGGGKVDISIYLKQLLQVNIQSRGPYVAYKPNDMTELFYKARPLMFTNIETCKPYYDFNDFLNGETDDYSYDDVKIEHKKTKYTEFSTKEFKYILAQRRQELQKKNTKQPVDIIVFTDSFSYSATSMFIKGLQNEGGAIIVGYNGNPKLGKELFDASQSPTAVYQYAETKENANLKSLGFHVQGISFIETFDEDYKKGHPTPREYKVDLIDERSDILEAYSDETYQLFMNESKRIFKRYKGRGECNPNNTNLIIEMGDCKWEDDTHAHGGNPCGSDGKWNETNCQKSYCDYGYYYSKIEDKCLIDNCTNSLQEKQIILNGEYKETITLNKENNYEYTFRINTKDYLYVFEASEPGYMHFEMNNPCPSLICTLNPDEGKIHLNYFRNVTDKEIKFNITSIKNFPGIIQSRFLGNVQIELIEQLPTKLILIVESNSNLIYFPRVFDETTKMYKAEYSKEMKVEDIANINEKYFQEVKNEIIEPTPNKIYIFAIKTENIGSLSNIYIQPKLYQTNIVLSPELLPRVLYFSKDIKEYTIDFANNKHKRMIQLSKATLDSEITIKNHENGKEEKLNKNNAYYVLESSTAPYFINKLTISVTKGDSAIIEFLFPSDKNHEIISSKEIINHKITKTTIIKFDENTKDSNIQFTLTSRSEKEFGYVLIKYYSKNNYVPYPEALLVDIAPSNKYNFEIYNPKETLEKDESFSIIIFINQASLINDEILLTKKEKEDERLPISELYQEVTPDYMKDVITNIKTLLGSFIFADILKEPPEPYENDTVDIISEFDKININQNRPFYEFYRDIKMTLSRTRDANLDILGSRVTFGKDTYDFDYYRMCLPFKFYMDNKNNTEVKMYIQEYGFCSKYFDSNVTRTIKELENVPLEKINGSDPFDFVYKFSQEFYNLKNRDAQFANMIDVIPDNTLVYQPLTPWQLNYIKLEFNNKKELVTHYHVIKEKVDNEENKQASYLDWDIKSANGEIKCRVDTTNKLNVLFLSSLFVDSKTIEQCAEKFYSNDNKIVIITSQLWEGDTHNAYLYSQMLFPKLNIKFNLAMKQSELTKQLYESDKSHYVKPDTCRSFDTWENLVGGSHAKTNVYNPITEGEVLDLAAIRRKLKELGHLKKSTEILILTDTVNMGAGSLFIKTIQRNGGAIIASYGGNPKLDKTKIQQLDASLDPAFSSKFEFSSQYKALKEKGFVIYGIPYAEAFKDNKIAVNEIPMAFEVNKADEMTNIYHFYDDIYYYEFIKEAKNIFEKYNEKQECSKNNPYLVLETDECKFDSNFTHGGYKCGEDGKWKKNASSCQESYCDIEYYFNEDDNVLSCKKDKCLESEEIILKGDDNRTITIIEEKRYVVRTETDNYIYFFESNEPGFMQYEDQPCPSLICVLQNKLNNKIFLNYEQKELPDDKNITIKITAVKSFNGYIQSLQLSGETLPLIESLPEKAIFIFESKMDYIYYENTIENPPKIFSAKYDNKITLDDIVSINKDKFKEEKGPILESKENETFIIAFTTDNKRNLVELIAMPKKGQKETNITDDKSPKIMYLSKDIKQYTLDFKENTLERMIHLSKDKTGGEIVIKNEKTGKEVTINEKSPYYIFENTNAAFKDKLTLTVKNDNDAIIEFLFNPYPSYDIKDEKEISNELLRKPIIINFEKNTKDININITLTSKNNFAYSNITYNSKNNYIPYNPNTVIPRTISGSNNYLIQIYNKKETNDEVLGLLIYIDPNDAIYLTKKEDIRKVDPTDIPTPTDKKEEDDGGLPGWAIALIVLGSVIVAAVIAIIVWKCLVSKDRVNSELIGSLTNPSQGKENELNVDQ